MTGRMVTLVGADGSGKSTQAKALCTSIGARARCIYMGSNPAAITHALPSTRALIWLKRALGRNVHHSGPPRLGERRRPSSPVARGLQHFKSLGVLALRVSEELYRLLLAKSFARRGFLVVIDRHPYLDYYARRVRRDGEWRRWGDRIHGTLLEHVYPRPSHLILLDAPAEVLYRRKPEGSLAALRARRQEYLDTIGMLEDVEVTIVDVDRTEDEVLADLLRIAEQAPAADAYIDPKADTGTAPREG